MKKLTMLFLATLMAGCSILSGCAKEEASSESPTSTQQKTEANSSEKNKTIKNNSNVKVPDDFVLATESQLEALPDADELMDAVDAALKTIGVQEIESTTYGNYNKVGSAIMADIYVVTDLRKLVVDIQYFNERWSVAFIYNAENGNKYYPLAGVNVYDYTSGECINPKKETEQTEATAPPDEGGENLGTITRNISELEINGEKIIDITTRDMKEYDYIKDVYISVDESSNEVNIAVQVPVSTNTDTAKMAGEDVVRYLAAMAGNANSYFKLPGSDDLGGIYDQYSLLIYVDDGNENLALYGAKVTTSNKITWR